jgi:DNA-binding HxlR family transcriptional regulator
MSMDLYLRRPARLTVSSGSDHSMRVRFVMPPSCEAGGDSTSTESVPPARRAVAYAPRVRYGQFCSIARALDLLGERWTLLIVRELLCGSIRFNDIQRGIPRISRTMLSLRLHALADAGVIEKGRAGATTYRLTAAGSELAPLVEQLGVWGHRHLPRRLTRDELDPAPLLWDMRRRVRHPALPDQPIVIRIELTDRHVRRYLLLRRTEASLCAENPGFPEEVAVTATTAVLAAWWRGDIEYAQARRAGLTVTGDAARVRAFPSWFERYALAEIEPATRRRSRRVRPSS